MLPQFLLYSAKSIMLFLKTLHEGKFVVKVVKPDVITRCHKQIVTCRHINTVRQENTRIHRHLLTWPLWTTIPNTHRLGHVYVHLISNYTYLNSIIYMYNILVYKDSSSTLTCSVYLPELSKPLITRVVILVLFCP